jgi:hypothetical protein
MHVAPYILATLWALELMFTFRSVVCGFSRDTQAQRGRGMDVDTGQRPDPPRIPAASQADGSAVCSRAGRPRFLWPTTPRQRR